MRGDTAGVLAFHEQVLLTAHEAQARYERLLAARRENCRRKKREEDEAAQAG